MQMPAAAAAAAAGSSYHPEEGSPSFFKVIRYPSSPHLVLPNAFVRRYFKKIPKKPTLVTETRDHSWRMEFVKIGEDYCFAHGWEKLVKEVQLCLRDIVVFWLIDSLTFKVIFLGSNGCQKDFPCDKTNFADDDDFVVKTVKYDGQDGDIVGGYNDGGKWHDVDDDHHQGMADMDLRFEKVFSGKNYGTYFMSLPMKFVRAAELEHSKSLKLKDHEGKEWRMGILAERYKRTKYSLSAGWSKFRKYHNLSEGDVCKFTFDKDEGVLNLTQMIKSKRRNKQDAPVEEVDWWPTKKPVGEKVKIEYDSGLQMEGVERKRGMLNSFADVKIEDGSDTKMAVEAGKSGMPPQGGRVEVQPEPWAEREFRSKHVIYF